MKEIKLEDLKINPCLLIGKEWMLVSSGTEDKFNMMTASWGHIGALWGHHLDGRATTEIFIRPSRYTDLFLDRNECYSLCFFDDEYHTDLAYLGSHSGRNDNKLDKTKFHVKFIDGVPCYEEAKLIIICKKIYKGKIEENGFIDQNIIPEYYPYGDFHNVYVGEILKILEK